MQFDQFLTAVVVAMNIRTAALDPGLNDTPHNSCVYNNPKYGINLFCRGTDDHILVLPDTFDVTMIRSDVERLYVDWAVVEDNYTAIPARSALRVIQFETINYHPHDIRFPLAGLLVNVKYELEILLLSVVKLMFVTSSDFDGFNSLLTLTLVKCNLSDISVSAFAGLGMSPSGPILGYRSSLEELEILGNEYLDSLDWSFLKPVSESLKFFDASYTLLETLTCSVPFTLQKTANIHLYETRLPFLPDAVYQTFNTSLKLQLKLDSLEGFCQEKLSDCGCCQLYPFAKWLRQHNQTDAVRSITCGRRAATYSAGSFPGNLSFASCESTTTRASTERLVLITLATNSTDEETLPFQSTSNATKEPIPNSTPSRENTLVTTLATSKSTDEASESLTGNTDRTPASTSTESVTDGTESTIALIATTVVVTSVLVAASIACLLFIRRRRRVKHNGLGTIEDDQDLELSERLPTTGNPDVDVLVRQFAQLMEMSPSAIKIGKEVLGEGEFGVVFKGSAYSLPNVVKLTQTPTTVAIKTADKNASLAEKGKFIDELRLMTKLGHHVNVVNLLGVVIQDNLMLVLEYCCYGSLQGYLQTRRRAGLVYEHVNEHGALLPLDEEELHAKWLTGLANQNAELRALGTHSRRDYNEADMLSTNNLIAMAYQVSRGMEHLTFRSILHRDLAARNVLVAENRILKIADFGLSKHGQTQYTVSNMLTALPVRWMPPEAIMTGTFSQTSDVWSFGVLLWEIFSLGQAPFTDLDMGQYSAISFAAWLADGNQMRRPSGAPTVIHDIARQCWNLQAGERPNFTELRNQIDTIMSTSANCKAYLGLLKEPELCPETERQREIIESKLMDLQANCI